MKLSELLAPLLDAKADHETIRAMIRAYEAAEENAVEQGREKARARWHRWNNKRLQTPANISNPLVRVEGSSSKKDISGKEEKEVRAPAARTPCQELESVIDHEHAAAVVEHRQRIKKPLTAYAARKLAASLSKAPDANAAADTMIANGWQGFDPSWLESRTTRPPSTASPPAPRNAGELARLKLNGTIHHEPATRTDDRRLDTGNGERQAEGTGIARRFAVSSDILGRVG